MSDQDPNKLDDDFFDDEKDLSEDSFDDGLYDEASDDADLDYIDDDFMDDGWDEELYGTPDEGLIQQNSKKREISRPMIIGITLLVGFCVLVYQVIVSRPEAVEHFKTALSMTGATDGPIFGNKDKGQKEKPETLEIEKGFLDNPELLDDTQNQKAEQEATPPMPVPIAQEPEQGKENVLTPLPEAEGFVDAAQMLGGESKQVPRGPNDDDTLTETDQSEPDNKAQALLEKTLAARNEEKTGDEINSPQEGGFGFENSLGFGNEDPLLGSQQIINEKTEQKDSDSENNTITKIMPTSKGPIQDEQTAVTTEQEADTSGNLPTEAQKEALAEIETMKREIASLKAELAQRTAQNDALKATVQTAKNAQTKAATQAVPSKQIQKPAPVQQSSSTKWVLRAAQPGKAWVSQQGQRDMRSVVVGDSLPGIGRITEISFSNGHWTVQGTTGKITR